MGLLGSSGPVYLEGNYSEIYPDKSEDYERDAALLSSSFPSLATSVATSLLKPPGSIHEGGELGYSVSHAYGTILDNPDLITCCVVGDGEAETGSSGHRLALQQVHQPGAGWGGAPRPQPERLQDCQPCHRWPGISHEELEGPVPGLRLHPPTLWRAATPPKCTRRWPR